MADAATEFLRQANADNAAAAAGGLTVKQAVIIAKTQALLDSLIARFNGDFLDYNGPTITQMKVASVNLQAIIDGTIK